MKNKQFDERQLLARGKAYQWATLTFIFELAIWCILQEAAGFSAAPIGEFLMLLMPPFVVFMIVCIKEDAFDPINSKAGMVLFSIWAIISIAMFIMKFNEKVPLIEGKRITEDGGIIIMYAGWIISGIVYWIKYFVDTKKEKRDWE